MNIRMLKQFKRYFCRIERKNENPQNLVTEIITNKKIKKIKKVC
jgi:hypothetical protein